MLEDYIVAYEKALKEHDAKAQKKIERDLAKLGMDKITLMTIVKERG